MASTLLLFYREQRPYTLPMCGRFAIDRDLNQLFTTYVEAGGRAEDLNDRLTAAMLPWRPRFSVAPTSTVPIVRERLDADGVLSRELDPAVWDFRPHWRRDIGKRPQINARLETLLEKPMWRDSTKTRRAIVPMTGYFEWTGKAGSKIPHYITGDVELAAAGLWITRKVEDGFELSTVVVTRQGVDAAGEVHDRMPAYLTRDLWADWLSPASPDDPAGLLAEVAESSQQVGSQLRSWVVDTKVNSTAKVDPYDPSLVEPV